MTTTSILNPGDYIACPGGCQRVINRRHDGSLWSHDGVTLDDDAPLFGAGERVADDSRDLAVNARMPQACKEKFGCVLNTVRSEYFHPDLNV